MSTDRIKGSMDGIIVQEWSLSSEDYETPLPDLYHCHDFIKKFTICGAYKRSDIPNVRNLWQRLVFMAIHGYLIKLCLDWQILCSNLYHLNNISYKTKRCKFSVKHTENCFFLNLLNFRELRHGPLAYLKKMLLQIILIFLQFK